MERVKNVIYAYLSSLLITKQDLGRIVLCEIFERLDEERKCWFEIDAVCSEDELWWILLDLLRKGFAP